MHIMWQFKSSIHAVIHTITKCFKLFSNYEIKRQNLLKTFDFCYL